MNRIKTAITELEAASHAMSEALYKSAAGAALAHKRVDHNLARRMVPRPAPPKRTLWMQNLR